MVEVAILRPQPASDLELTGYLNPPRNRLPFKGLYLCTEIIIRNPKNLPVHGRDRIKHVHVYSLLGLSTHKHVKCYPTMTKFNHN